MKRFWKNIAFALALPLLAIGCTTDYPEPNINDMPQASDLLPRIEIDQDQNLVTFSIDNSGMVPMWIFGDEPIDGKVSKKYAYTQNGVTLRIRDKGTHQVELKAYNRNGISVGSKMVEFTMDNQYRDPFDATPYIKALSNGSSQNWMWNSTVDNHFGCGQSGANPTEWYAAKAGEKTQLYDDMLTFTVDGEYTFDPGADGMVYVNKDSGYKPEFYAGNDEDYLAPIDAYTTTFEIEQQWNEAGIEEIYLVLPEKTNLSYIPNPTAYAEPRFRFMEIAASSIKKTMKLVMDTPTENGGGGIAWYYEFVPTGKVVTEEEMLAGTTAEGKVWIMDAAAPGHLGCGESAENPAGWWSASAYEKAESGMYDNELTFYPDGKYAFNPGADGMIYVNWGCTLVGPNTGSEPDNSVAWSTQEATYTFANGKITLPEGFTIGYIPSDGVYTDPTFIVTELTETKLTLVSFDNIAWQYKFTARDAQPETVTFDGQEFVNGMVETSLAQNADIAITGIDLNEVWVDPDFFTMVDASTLKFNAVSGEYRIIWDGKWFKVLPIKNGETTTYDNNGDLWIIGDGGGKPSLDGQIGWVTEAALPCARIDEKTYRITLAMKAEGGSIKVFGQADWGVEWTKNKYNVIEDNGLFNIPDDDGNIKTLNATPGFYTFTFVDNDGILDMSVKKAKLGDTTIYDPTATENLWLSATINEMFYFYAPNWSQIADPELEENGNDYTITLPEATSDQWQAQVAFKTSMSSSSAKNYDFYVELTSNEDHPGVTVKLVKEGDDNTFYFADRHALTADETYVYKVSNMAGLDIDNINLFFDFGGNAAGTEINIKNILFQEHREEE